MSEQYQLIESRLYNAHDNGTVTCNACLWRCKLNHGQRGFCQALVNRNGALYNLSYGIVSAIDVELIDMKPVYHYQKGSKVMSVGSFGCNFRCKGCHNLEISWGVDALDDLAKGQSTKAFVSPSDLVDAALRHNVKGIAFTYSEPAVWLEYVIDVAKIAHEKGLFTVYVSNSYITDEALEMVAPYIDVLCSDVKSMTDEFYQDVCPTSTVKEVLASIKKAHDLGIHVETRTNIIPTKNDSLEEMNEIARWIKDNLGADSPWHITKFFPAYELSHLPPTPHAIIEQAAEQAAEQAKKIGLTNVYAHIDISCDCATENMPVSAYLDKDINAVNQVNKCAASCCGDEGILLKKFEKAAGIID